MTKGELVERLKPLHVVDQPLIAVADVLIAEKRPGVAAVVDAWILENNALKSEAATALSEQAARIEELELELDAVRAFGVGFYAPNVEEATREAYRSIARRDRKVTPEELAAWDEYKRQHNTGSVRFDPKDETDFWPWLKERRRDRTTEKKDG